MATVSVPESALRPNPKFPKLTIYVAGENVAPFTSDVERFEPHRCGKSPKEAVGLFGDKMITKRVSFVPLKSEQRFRIGQCDFRVRFPDVTYTELDGEPKTPEEERRRLWSQWSKEMNAMGLPQSCLDVPPSGACCLEFGDEPLLTREQAFEIAAKLNSEAVDELGGAIVDSNQYRWHVVVELGEAVAAFHHLSLEDGSGFEEVTTRHPARLVMPTDAERERHSLEWVDAEPEAEQQATA